MRTVSLMGSTGSVGTQALDVIRREPERFRVHALAAHRSSAALVAQAAEFRPDVVVIGDADLYDEVRIGVPAGTEVAASTVALGRVTPLARLSQLAARTVLLAARHRSMADEANATSRIVIWTSSNIALTSAER